MTVHKKSLRQQAGDTLVEVLLATVILSIVVASSFALVNRSSRINQNSSERSEAVSILREQAEWLRQYKQFETQWVASPLFPTNPWDQVTAHLTSTSASPPDPVQDCKGFIEDPGVTSPQTGTNAAFYFTGLSAFRANHVIDDFSDSYGGGYTVDYYVWIEPYGNPSVNHYIDFYIHVCWAGAGGLGAQNSSMVYRMRTL